MATETFILRPTSYYSNLSSSNVIFYPTDTAIENAHLLVSDIVADDDATYIGNKNQIQDVSFLFTEPSKYEGIVPISLRVICRSLSQNKDAVNLRLTYSKLNDDESAVSVGNMLADYTFLESNIYENIQFECTSTQITEIWKLLKKYKTNSLTEEGLIGFKAKHSSNNDKTNYVYVTQFYIEVEYEIKSDTSIYLNESNSMVQLNGPIYQKQNGIWVECDNNVLSSNQKYNLQVISN